MTRLIPCLFLALFLGCDRIEIVPPLVDAGLSPRLRIQIVPAPVRSIVAFDEAEQGIFKHVAKRPNGILKDTTPFVGPPAPDPRPFTADDARALTRTAKTAPADVTPLLHLALSAIEDAARHGRSEVVFVMAQEAPAEVRWRLRWVLERRGFVAVEKAGVLAVGW